MTKLDRKNIQDMFRLTPTQEGILFHYLEHPGSVQYVEQIVIGLTGDLDLERLGRCWDIVIAAHPSLRTVFRWENVTSPVQVVLRRWSLTVSFHDLSTLGGPERLEELDNRLREDRKQGFDLSLVPLRVTVFRIGPNQYQMVVTHHHIISDGWSNSIMLQDLFTTYRHERGSIQPAPPIHQFKEYVKWLRHNPSDFDKDFWSEYLEGVDTLTTVHRQEIEVSSQDSALPEIFEISEALGASIDKLAHVHHLTPATLFSAVSGLLMQRYANRRDVVFGTALSGRSVPVNGIENMVGLLIHTVPVRVVTKTGDSIGATLERIGWQLQKVEEHARLPLVDIKACSQYQGPEELFRVLLVVENYPVQGVLGQDAGGISFNSVKANEVTNYDLTIVVRDLGSYELSILYDHRYYSPSFIRRMGVHFIRILEAMVSTYDGIADEIDILTEEDRRSVLFDLNGEPYNQPLSPSIWGAVLSQARQHPDAAAIEEPQGNGLRAFTVGEFLLQANTWKHKLQNLGVKPGHIVGFVARRTADLVAAIFGALAAGATYLPVDPNLPPMRMLFMLRDSNIKVLVGHDDIMEPLDDFPHRLSLDTTEWETGPLDIDDCERHDVGDYLNIIYTSGSTGVPKGVMIRQWSVINLLSYLQKMVGFTADDCLLFKTTYSFDVSISEIFGWMWGGSRLAILPSGQEKEPLAILETIRRRRVTVANFVPSLFTAFCNFLEPSNIQMLSSLRIIFLGGEPVLPETIQAFAKWNLDVPLINAYGPTETTIYTTLYDLGLWNGTGRISVGLPVAGAELAILNIFGQVQPKGAPGELVISGTGVSGGYQNNIDLTSQKYNETKKIKGLAAIWSDYPTFYRVGDLISLPLQGQLEFLGRMDQQVKIRGFRIELGEIEDLLLKHPAVAEVAVIVHQASNSDKSLVAFIIPEQTIDHGAIRDYLADHLPSYMVPAQFVELQNFPRTTSGKVDRKVLAPPEEKAETRFTPPRNVLERQVANIWASVLGIDEDQLDVNKDFYDFGGHSIKAIALIARVYKQFSIRMSVADVFQNPTIALMAIELAKARETVSLELTPLEAKDYYPASSAQRRLLVLQQMEPDSTLYNMPVVLKINGPLRREKVASIFKRLILRHPVLRTGFDTVNDQPVQRIFKDVPFHLEDVDPHMPSEHYSTFIRPFDLSQPPLLRVGMAAPNRERHLLLLDIHHIISDGTSMNILMREFLKLYADEDLPDLQYRYVDYSKWQVGLDHDGTFQKQERFWLEQFSDGVPVVELPTDRKRPLIRDEKGICLNISWGSEQAAALKGLMEETGATGYMVFSAILNVLLSKLSGEEDIVTGGVIEGRRFQEFQPVAGMFVNTIALRHSTSGGKSFKTLIADVKEKILKASQHSDYPFERLVEKIWDNRDPGRHPLFDVMMTFDQEGLSEQSVNGLSIIPIPVPRRTAKFDITIGTQLRDGAVELEIEYSISIYNEPTVRRFAAYLKAILATTASQPGILLKDIELIDEGERKRLLQMLDNTGEKAFIKKTIQQRFKEMVNLKPNRIALSLGTCTITYKRLDTMARRTEAVLRTHGIFPGDIVALAMERSLEMVGAILGVLYAQACYLPIDPNFPTGRISYMLSDSAVRICLTNDEFQLPPQGNTKQLSWETISSSETSKVSECGGSPTDAAYIIYTSGTTGKPKGVVIEQGNVSRLLFCGGFQFDFSSRDIWTMFHSYCFDFSVWEMYGALLFGGKLVMIPSAVSRDAEQFSRLLKRECVTVLNQTPSAFYALADQEISNQRNELSLRYVIFGGEELNPRKLRDFNNRYPRVLLINMFGITETTVHVTFKRLTFEDIEAGDSNIGGPIPTMALHIVDHHGNLAPQGVAGELVVGGAGVGRGYLNRPELTADKFGEDPFGREFDIYRSGDKARLLENGDIQYLGRIDQQVQIRGFRVEMGEIQARLLQQPVVKDAVVIDRKDPAGDSCLCAYLVWQGQPLSTTVLEERLSLHLPHYMIPQFFVTIGNIPLTANGKLDRKSLPDPLAHDESEERVALSDPLEIQLASVWAGLLGVPQETIDYEANFFQLGGHSLKAAALVSRIHRQLGIKVPLVEIFRNPSLRGIAGLLRRHSHLSISSIPKTEQRDYYPLTSSQRRLYILHQLNPSDKSYNVPVAIEFMGKVDLTRVKSAWKCLIDTYEILRTSFVIFGDGPVQRVHSSDEVLLEIAEGSVEPGDAENISPLLDGLFASFIQPFDLSQTPLLRISIQKLSESRSIMLLDMHHIICDAIASSVLIREFSRLYGGGDVGNPHLQYRDYAVWQQGFLSGASTRSQEEYWLQRFAQEVPVLALPFDQGDVNNPHHGESCVWRLPDNLRDTMKQFVSRGNITVFMAMLSCLSIFLRKVSNQADIVVGTPVAGRKHPDLESIPGIFINTLPIRIRVDDNDSVQAHIEVVRELAIQAFANQDYPFEELVDRVVKDRDTGNKPLFDIMLVAQDVDRPQLSLEGIDATSHYYSHRAPKFELTVTIEEADDYLDIYFNYSPRRFSSDAMTRLVGYFQNVFTALVTQPETRIHEVEILPEQEKMYLLETFSTGGDSSPGTTALQVFEDAVRRHSQTPALTVPQINPGGDGDIQTLTYEQLDQFSHQMAGRLRKRGVQPGDIVAILAEPSLEMMTGILGVIKCGAAYLPIDPRNPEERTRYILADSHSALLLAMEGLDVPQTADVLRMTLDSSLLPEGTNHFEAVDIDPGDVLYAIYTSGTTGRSKGVLLTHGNMVNYVEWFREFAGLKPGDQTILTSSFSFDLGYTSIYSALLSGCRLHLVPRTTILSAESLLSYLYHHKITYIKVTPSLFSTLVESPSFQEGKLKPLRLAIIGGEAIKFQDVRRAVQAYPHLQIVNHYGPTETTIGSIAIKYKVEDIQEQAPRPVIGRPIANTQIIIADTLSNLLPIGVAGEICISGRGVGRGYVNRPLLTGEKFVKNPYHDGQMMYRTGDLGRYTNEETIEFLGRMDHQVKIRGYRVELGEIENTLLTIPEVIEAVVLVNRTLAAESLLCAYVVGGEELDTNAINLHLQSQLPDYMIPAFIIPLDRLPLTPNGKLDRKALPAPKWDGSGKNAIAPRDEVERELALIWSDLLGIETLGDIDANFFHLGGHSLKAIHLVSRIQAVFGIQIPLADIFSEPTIRGLGHIVKTSERLNSFMIERAEEQDRYPLSSAQKRMFILQQMDPQSIAYNMPAMFKIIGNLETDLLRQRFETLLKRHDSFRTSFFSKDGRLYQQVHQHVEMNVEFYSQEFDSAIGQFIRPFNVSKAPLFRIGLAENRAGERALLIDMHHIIADGASRAKLIQEFALLGSDQELPLPGLRYIDYCCWQDSQLAGDSSQLARQKEFWLDTFAGELPVLDLPLDFPRPKSRSFNGGEETFSIDETTFNKLNTLAQFRNMTVYMVMMGIVTILLSKYSGQEDIVVGTVSEGRRDVELDAVIGMFVNTLALRLRPERDKTVQQYLQEVKSSVLAIFENQDYPFEELVEAIGDQRDTNRNPLFDVLFVLESRRSSTLKSEGFSLEPLPLRRNSAKFDLALLGKESSAGLDIVLEYNSDILSASSIKRMGGCLGRIITQVLDNSNLPLGSISIIDDSQMREILNDFNNTRRDYPANKTIHCLFAEIAEETPLSTAVVYDDQTVTYGELETRARSTASGIMKLGIEAGSVVGVIGRRGIDTIIALLSILKAGCTYMPINPDYPPERKRLLLDNAAASYMISREGDDVSGWSGKRVTINIELDRNQKELLSYESPSDCGAYIMYTSGSTGIPKGVMVDHHSVLRLVKNTNYISFTPDMRILQTGALEFDASTFEIWGALLNGLVLCLADKVHILTAAGLKDVLTKYRISTIWLTSSLFNQLSQNDISIFQGLRHLLVGGEALSPAHINRFQETYPQIALINGYGPTENTTFSTYYRISKIHTDNIPIGGPIANSTAYIFDRKGNLQPKKVPGELWVGGDGVARGYLNDPELTAEKFVSHPLFPGQRLYRTGDLTRWTEDGVIEFLGRIDQQVKIRGFRVEPAEIQQILVGMNGIKDAFVMAAKQHEGTLYLCAYIVADEKLQPGTIRQGLEATLPAYMIPSYFIRIHRIPLTANGKVDTRSLPTPQMTVDVTSDPPKGDTEVKLADLWAAILGINKKRIGRNQNFFESGGHSLRATKLATDIHREMNVDLPLAEIFARPILRELAEAIDAIKPRRHDLMERVEDQDFYTASAAQKRLFILHRINPTSTGYNIPIALKVKGDLDRDRLQKALNALVARHESLRTSFEMKNDEPVQIVHPSATITIQNIQLADYDAAIQQFIEPFDLQSAPLMRVGLAEVGVSEYLLLVDLHHIIADGLSLGIIVRDFLNLYEEKNLEQLGVRYRDFAHWQWQRPEAVIHRHLQFWLDKFSGGVPVLDLPSDFQRPVEHNHQGDWLDMEIQPDEYRAIQTSCQRSGATKFMFFMTTLSILLARLSHQEQVVVGTPVSGRGHAAVEDVVGMFVNTLPLPVEYDGEESFASFLLRQKTMILEAFKHQDAPFEILAEQLDLVRDTSRNPLFDVMMTYHSADEDYLPLFQTGDLRVSEYRRRNTATKFDLTVHVQEKGDRMLVTWEYYTSLFLPTTIHEFISYFRKILSEVSRDESVKLRDIELMSAGQKNEFLYQWNQTDVAEPQKATVHQLFRRQAKKSPAAIAIVENHLHYSYHCLEEQSENVSRSLRSRGIAPGSIIAVTAGHSAEVVAWILGILKAGCAFLPIDPRYPDYRMRYILADSAVSVLVGTSDQLPGIEFSGDFLDIGNDLLTDSSLEAALVENRPLDPCYVIYTSGSTGTPKGVVVEHATIVNYLLWGAKQYLEKESNAVFPLYTSLAFDLTITSMFLPLITGNTVAVFDPGETGDVIRDIVGGHSIDILKATPTHLKMLAMGGKGQNRLKTIIVGGEELETGLVEEIRARFGNHLAVYNEYGPTEATVGCMIYRCDGTSQRRSVPIGIPIQNGRIYLLDRYMKPVPSMVTGEMYIGGNVLARGYLNAPPLTEERFVPNPFMSGERLYRTGDMARRLRDGNLEFFGRVDHQVKIRGYRIELDEIRQQLLLLENVADAVVVTREDTSGDLTLCAYMVMAEELNEQAVRVWLSQRLPAYMVPVSYTSIPRIPITANGKLDKRALPEPEFTGNNYVAPETKIQRDIITIWSSILGIPVEKIGVHDNFFRLGGHSLKAVVLAAKLEELLGLDIPMSAIFSEPTVCAMAQYANIHPKDRTSTVSLAEKRDAYPLTFAQRRLYSIHQLDPEGITYNTPVVALLSGEFDIQRFQQALNKLICRHQSLRTSFQSHVDDAPVQKVLESVELPITFIDVLDEDALDVDDLLTRYGLIRPFRLSVAPLMRVQILKLATERHLLVMDMHHIISDGVSFGLMLVEFFALYDQKQLAPVTLHYSDYAVWQRSIEGQKEVAKQETFWLRQFDDNVPVMELPVDFARPAVRDFEGNRHRFRLDQDATLRLKEIAKAENTTLFMVMLALYTIFLSKLTGQDDVVLGTPVAGRNRGGLEAVQGMFVNTMVMRYRPIARRTLKAYIEYVTHHTLAGFDNQEYPFEDLIEKLNVPVDTSRNPLFDVMFALQEETGTETLCQSLSFVPQEFHSTIAKFDMTMVAVDGDDHIQFSLEYGTSLFNQDTIRRFSDYWIHLLSDVAEKLNQPLLELEMIDSDERHRIITEFNRSQTGFPAHKTIPQLFTDIAHGQPDHTAFIYSDNFVTYNEFHKRGLQLAANLKENGVNDGDIVGLVVDRGLDMMVGIMGILLSGCAYLPVNTSSPPSRMNYMLKDSHARIVVGSSNYSDSIAQEYEFINIEDQKIFSGKSKNINISCGIGDNAYVIYTSGTTGKPKGVLLSHKNVLRLACSSMYLQINAHDRFLQISNFAFDGSVFDIFGTFLNGAALVLTSSQDLVELELLAAKIRRECISVFLITTALFNALVDISIECFHDVKKVLFGAERVSLEHCRKLLDYLGPGRMLHMYGPSEVTVYTSYYQVDFIAEHQFTVPIGGPIDNTCVYILNAERQVLPIGVIGEIYIGGHGLATGYLNRPEMTNENFVDHPFHPGEKLYRSGDLGRWLTGGVIEFRGRIDHQVKIRGFRIEPGEIEKELLLIEGVKESLVLAEAKKSGEKYLAAYLVGNGAVNIDDVKRQLSEILPHYMIPSYFFVLEQFQMTANGKIDRSKLPVISWDEHDEFVAPVDSNHQKMARIWESVLGVEPVGMTDHFFDKGGHSIAATRLVNTIHREFGIRVKIVDLYRLPELGEFCLHVFSRHASGFDVIPKLSLKKYYDVSFTQKRMWVLFKKNPYETSFNLSGSIVFNKPPNDGAIEWAMQTLVDRHEAFRTYFEERDGEPVQVVEDSIKVDIELADISRLSQEKRAAELEKIAKERMARPFNILVPPLYSCTLVKMDEHQFNLLMIMHHIVSDGWSMEILRNEFLNLLECAAVDRREYLDPLKIQYKDYAAWHNRMLSSNNESMDARDFWVGQLNNDIGPLALPTTGGSVARDDSEAAAYRFVMRHERLIQLNSIAKSSESTLFMVMMAGLKIMLWQLTGQKDISIAIPAAGRPHQDVMNVVGFFVNTLILHHTIDAELSFEEFLRRVQQDTYQVLEYQTFPLELIFGELNVPYPDISVFFNMLNIRNTGSKELTDFSSYHKDRSGDAKYDIVFYVTPFKNGIELVVAYKKNSFTPATIEKITQLYQKVLNNICQKPDNKIKEYRVSSRKRLSRKKLQG